MKLLSLTPTELRELKEAVYEKQARLEQAYTAFTDRRAKKQMAVKRRTLATLIYKLENQTKLLKK